MKATIFKRSGFTLVELLVVVAIVAILASMLLPALGRAKAKARSIQCLSNLNQLSLAVRMYAGDHSGAFPYNFGSADTRKSIGDGTYLNWANNVMSWELDSDNTNRVWATTRGISPYLGNSVGIYRCPSDNALSAIQRSAGWRNRIRSYSMNAMMGDAGKFSQAGGNINNPSYRQFHRDTEIPNPANFFVFVDEHPDSINDGYFLNKFYSREWFDLPASNHGGVGVLTFADGHGETRKWAFESTKPPSEPDGASLPIQIPRSELGDFNWLLERTSFKTGSIY